MYAVEPEKLDEVKRPKEPPAEPDARTPVPGRLTPAMLLQLQRTVGNAEACRLLARRPQVQATQAVTPAPAKAGRVIQRRIGRTDGSDDMNADEVQLWLKNAGVWDTIPNHILDVIEGMMQSTHQWTYPGMGTLSLVSDARELLQPVDYQRGLIHGTLKRTDNSADFHVDPGDGKTLGADMLWVAEDVYDKMTVVSTLPGRNDGLVEMRPQGAAVIKIVAQLLGEALGDPEHIKLAHDAIAWRKVKEKAWDFATSWAIGKAEKHGDVLEKSVSTEHAEYMKSLVGLTGVEIQPLLKKASLTAAQFLQNMLEASLAGQARLQDYLDQVEEAKHPVSMVIRLNRTRLPAVIAILKRPPVK